jgi:hypothetical protein
MIISKESANEIKSPDCNQKPSLFFIPGKNYTEIIPAKIVERGEKDGRKNTIGKMPAGQH